MKLVEAPRRVRPEPEILPPYFEYDEEEVVTPDKNDSSTSDKPQAEANEPSPDTVEETKDQAPETNEAATPDNPPNADSSSKADT